MTWSFDEPMVVVFGVEEISQEDGVKEREFIYNIETMRNWRRLLMAYPHFGSKAHRISLCIEVDGDLYEWVEL